LKDPQLSQKARNTRNALFTLQFYRTNFAIEGFIIPESGEYPGIKENKSQYEKSDSSEDLKEVKPFFSQRFQS
jgi:hypothetical protein